MLDTHSAEPWPKMDSNWGVFNQALARLATTTTQNATALDSISREIEGWATPSRIPRALPLDDYSVKGPCAGLGARGLGVGLEL